jgi:hypothetical protein
MTNAALKMPFPMSLQKPGSSSRQSQPDRDIQPPQTSVPPRSRKRGVVLTLQGREKLQAAKSQAEFQENRGDRFTLEELSERTELSLGTLSKVLGCLEPVDRGSLQTVFQSFGLELNRSDYTRPGSQATQQTNLQQDQGETLDVSRFCGREIALISLQQQLSEERCRSLAVLGIGVMLSIQREDPLLLDSLDQKIEELFNGKVAEVLKYVEQGLLVSNDLLS